MIGRKPTKPHWDDPTTEEGATPLFDLADDMSADDALGPPASFPAASARSAIRATSPTGRASQTPAIIERKDGLGGALPSSRRAPPSSEGRGAVEQQPLPAGWVRAAPGVFDVAWPTPQRPTSSMAEERTQELTFPRLAAMAAAHPLADLSSAPFEEESTGGAPSSIDVESISLTGEELALFETGGAAPATTPEGPDLDLIRSRFEEGDYAGVLSCAKELLERHPALSPALRYQESAREQLRKGLLQRLGSDGQVPRLAVAQERLSTMQLDHRVGFLISLVDGVSTVEDIVDMAGMPAEDALAILCDMVEQEIVTLKPRPRKRG